MGPRDISLIIFELRFDQKNCFNKTHKNCNVNHLQTCTNIFSHPTPGTLEGAFLEGLKGYGWKFELCLSQRVRSKMSIYEILNRNSDIFTKWTDNSPPLNLPSSSQCILEPHRPR